MTSAVAFDGNKAYDICIVTDKFRDVYALGDRCPPKGNRLSLGKYNPELGTIQDHILGTEFSLATGKVVGPWCPRDRYGWFRTYSRDRRRVPVYPVRKGGEFLEVGIKRFIPIRSPVVSRLDTREMENGKS